MNTPTFSGKKQLVRYIDKVHRLKNRRPAVAAFLPDPPSADPSNDHLSVNSLEIEKIDEIATYHRWKWQNEEGQVALAVHKVHQYSDAAKKSGVELSYDKHQAIWFFSGSKKEPEMAYRHRPVKAHNNPYASPSHCGVEFSRVLKEHRASQFARRMTTQKFHLK
ncbi:hypothetical protein F2P47_03685 [Parvibaculum sedimenti]|uniref:Uncharacterized protein n=1 Tax=Parvibaculum sedimenti TaxID=2608632 RepID=A0A6N6VNQ2_9HYPH|nr:hypothetical protein [Parvibaculum sedimenti]KAB7741520.1 hypothetical protein F2P47_03685 [Parvibaculum sedimenti]